MLSILDRIANERLKRNWSEYQLAQNSGIAQSTISTWYRKQMQPSVSSLEKICTGLGITLAQFFSDDDEITNVTAEQLEILNLFNSLDLKDRELIVALLKSMTSK